MAMKRRDWALVVIAAAQGESLEPVQLQKALFLIGEELPDDVGDDYYSFRPYDYGPFDQAVYSDAESLAAEGLVTSSPIQYSQPSYLSSTTLAGQREAEVKSRLLSSDARAYVDEVVVWVRSLSFNELCDAIYAKYPEMAKNSVKENRSTPTDTRPPTLAVTRQAQAMAERAWKQMQNDDGYRISLEELRAQYGI